MFGLPLSTTLLLLGFPLFWIIYTLCFLYLTRNWRDEVSRQDADS